VPDNATSQNWPQRRYEAAFEETCTRLAIRRKTDPTFTIEELEGLLHTAYVAEGNNWTGRGAVHEITQSATIAAYEHTLAEWRAERGGQPNP